MRIRMIRRCWIESLSLSDLIPRPTGWMLGEEVGIESNKGRT